MDFLPLFFDVKDKVVLVVGGGDVASRKARLLISAHARIKLVAPEIKPALQTLVSDNGGECHQRDFGDDDLSGVSIVVAATDDTRVNAHIGVLAAKQNLPVNVVDDPSLCSFIFPAVPKNVHIVLSESGVTKIRHVPVGSSSFFFE